MRDTHADIVDASDEGLGVTCCGRSLSGQSEPFSCAVVSCFDDALDAERRGMCWAIRFRGTQRPCGGGGWVPCCGMLSAVCRVLDKQTTAGAIFFPVFSDTGGSGAGTSTASGREGGGSGFCTDEFESSFTDAEHTLLEGSPTELLQLRCGGVSDDADGLLKASSAVFCCWQGKAAGT